MSATAAPAKPRKQLEFWEGMPMSGDSETRFDKISATRKKNTEARNLRINERFNELYNKDRKRYDDVIIALCEEFTCVESTIIKALKD